MSSKNNHPIILFDGVCNLCNGFVQFLIKRDPEGHFRFAALQSEVGQNLLKEYNVATENLDTVVLIDKGQAYLRSDVALRIASQMNGLWPLFSIFRFLPRTLRDVIYDFIAARRYKWFGQEDQCMIPTPELKQRFLS